MSEFSYLEELRRNELIKEAEFLIEKLKQVREILKTDYQLLTYKDYCNMKTIIDRNILKEE